MERGRHAALLIVISYTLIAINFIVTLVESYLVVSVGFIFLGFGGSRWTAPYTERYIGLAVSIGIKILLLYCLIAAGFSLSIGWLGEAQGVATSSRPAMTAFDVMGGSLIFMMCCWQIPKLFSAVIGGSPALTGGDLVATAAVVGSAALAVGGAAVAGVGALAGGGSAAAGVGSAACSGGAGSTTTTAVASVGSVGSGSSSGGGSVSPPSPTSPGSAANSGGARRQPEPPSNSSGNGGAVDPPVTASRIHQNSANAEDVSSRTSASPPLASASSTLSSIGGEPLAGSGFEAQSPQRGFAPTMVNASGAATTTGQGTPSPPAHGGMSGAVDASSSIEGAARSNSTSAGNSEVGSDVASVGRAGPANPQPPTTAAKGKSGIARAAEQVKGLRRRLGSLPSDAAPHATPPRIPIDHEE
jgi:type IV secretion system protein TrbL